MAAATSPLRWLAFAFLLTSWGMPAAETPAWDGSPANSAWPADRKGESATSALDPKGSASDLRSVSGNNNVFAEAIHLEAALAGTRDRLVLDLGTLSIRGAGRGAGTDLRLLGDRAGYAASPRPRGGAQPAGTNALATSWLTFGAGSSRSALDLAGFDQRVAGLAAGETTRSAGTAGGNAANSAPGFGGVVQSTLGGANALGLRAAAGRPSLSDAEVYGNGTLLGMGAFRLANLTALRRGGSVDLSMGGDSPAADELTYADGGSYVRLRGGSPITWGATAGFNLTAAPFGADDSRPTVTAQTLSAPGTVAVAPGQSSGGGGGIDDRISLLGSFNPADLNSVMAVNQFASSGASFSVGVIRSGGIMQQVSAVPEFRPIYAAGLLLVIFSWTERRRLRQLFNGLRPSKRPV